jgi:hypothetical protein
MEGAADVHTLLPRAVHEDVQAPAAGLFDLAADVVAARIRAFLDR